MNLNIKTAQWQNWSEFNFFYKSYDYFLAVKADAFQQWGSTDVTYQWQNVFPNQFFSFGVCHVAPNSCYWNDYNIY